MARQPKFTDQQIADALTQALGFISQAAKVLKCDQDTVRKRIAKSEALQKIKADFDEETTDIAEIALRSLIQERNPWAIGFHLKTKGAKRGYVEQRNLNIGGQPDAAPIRVRFEKSMYDDLAQESESE